MKSLWSSFILCWLVLAAFLSPALSGLTTNRTQLEKIEARINRTEMALQNNKQSTLKISRELALLNKTMQRVRAQIDALQVEQRGLREKSDEEKKRINKSTLEVKKVGKRLKNRLVALYKEGETGAMKILFSTESVTEMVQQYHYLTRILQYDRELLDEYRRAIQVQQQQLDRLMVLEQKKGMLLQKKRQQQKVAEQGRKLQARLLKRAGRDKKKLNHEVSQLKKNSVRLKEMITRLERESEQRRKKERQIQRQPDRTTSSGAASFAVGRGKLGWPVKGRVMIGFGQQKDVKLGTYYESNGLEIEAPVGSEVCAVATGKVVFANYFKGYGNLYILTHPGGYHTLYAQMDRMEKKLNDHVAAGDRLGYSGLNGRDSIYFEIRSKGSPVNPLSWLMKR